MKILILIFLQITLLKCYKIEPIYPLENKTINLNNTNKYVIYEFQNELIDYLGSIYIYFRNYTQNNNNNITAKITSYYNISNISINEESGEISNYNEQQILYNNTFLTFNSYKGKIYFVISNFNQSFSAKMHLLNNYGYTDITNYDIFRYTYFFEPLNREYFFDSRYITFSIKNDIIKKNYLNFHIFNENSKTGGGFHAIGKISRKSIDQRYIYKYEDGILDISKFQNETILIHLSIGYDIDDKDPLPYLDYFEILIFYSEYDNFYPLYNLESSFAFIPSIRKQTYYIMLDVNNAYKNIYINAKTKNDNFTGKYYFYETNDIKEIKNDLSRTEKPGNNIPYSKIENNLYQIKINLIQPCKSVLLKIETYYNDIEYRLYFFNSILVNPFENYTFNLNEEQRFIIYNYIVPENEFIYTYFRNVNIQNTYIYLFSDIYKINIDNNDNISGYEEKLDLNSTINKYYSNNKEKIFILISNFINDYSDTINIINPNGYSDITNKQTIEYLYKIPNIENNINLTFSFNNKIKNKNFMYYQIFNYQDEQNDYTEIIEKNSLINIPKETYNYNNIINLTNYKNDNISIKFNISSKNKFDKLMIIIYFSDYKNLFKLTPEYDGNFYIPSIKPNEFFIYADISNIYKNFFFYIQTNKDEISNKYYFYENNDIEEICSNLPNNDDKYDGIYNSHLSENNQLEIALKKTDNMTQKSILLKMEIDTPINISFHKYKIYNIKPLKNKTIDLNSEIKYIIFVFDNEENGTIYTYFEKGNKASTFVSVYYDLYKFKIDEVNGKTLDYEEQNNLDGTTLLTFKSYCGKMYFVISDFINDIYDNFHLLNNYGNTDITEYDIFNYYFRFPRTEEGTDRYLRLSFDNSIKQKNFVFFQVIAPGATRYGTSIILKSTNSTIPHEEQFCDISKYKNETIIIYFKYTIEKRDYYKILIYYSDYGLIKPILSEKNYLLHIPGIL